jgi:hypothetical protein
MRLPKSVTYFLLGSLVNCGRVDLDPSSPIRFELTTELVEIGRGQADFILQSLPNQMELLYNSQASQVITVKSGVDLKECNGRYAITSRSYENDQIRLCSRFFDQQKILDQKRRLYLFSLIVMHEAIHSFNGGHNECDGFNLMCDSTVDGPKLSVSYQKNEWSLLEYTVRDKELICEATANRWSFCGTTRLLGLP